MSSYLKHFSILIVEDDIVCNDKLQAILTDKFLDVYSAVNIADGLELFEKKNPDIILSAIAFNDLESSKMNELLQSTGLKKPIVVMSTLDEHDALINAITLGVKDYLFKPINSDEIVHTLENIAEQLYITKQYNETNVLLKQYKKAVDFSCIVTKTDLKGNITYANQQFMDISGYTLDELIGKPHKIVRHPESSSAVFKDLWKTIKSKSTWQGVIKNRAKDGSTYIVSATVMPILNDSKEIMEYIAIRQDITELISQKEIIVRQTTDNLTKLPNREKLLEVLESSTYPNLALINIDNFRDVNDLYSFEVGDKILIETAKIINGYIQNTSCQLFKLPSDEFAVLIDTAKDVYSFEEMVSNIVTDLKSRAFYIDEHVIDISVTIGVSHSKRNLLSNADVALQDARKLKKHYLIYDEESNSREKTRENLNWHNIIKKAVKDNRIVPYFQPIYNLSTKKIEKYESLVRLIDEKGEIISPFFFLDIAKKYRLYEYITQIMINKTFEYFRDKDYEFSINLSIEDILDEHMVAFIISQIKAFNEPQRIVFEITESEGIENYLEVELFLRDIKEFGCKVAIDDFGTGYSNFEYIIKLNIDYLKIDGSLIKNIVNNRETKGVVETILLFAQKLGIKTITEFVSTEDSFEVMQELKADFVQGYFIGKPEELVQSDMR